MVLLEVCLSGRVKLTNVHGCNQQLVRDIGKLLNNGEVDQTIKWLGRIQVLELLSFWLLLFHFFIGCLQHRSANMFLRFSFWIAYLNLAWKQFTETSPLYWLNGFPATVEYVHRGRPLIVAHTYKCLLQGQITVSPAPVNAFYRGGPLRCPPL